MKLLYLAILTLLLCPYSYSQITQNLGDVDFVEVYDMLSVKLVPAEQNSIEITGDKAEDVEIISKNKKLKIRMRTAKVLQGEQTGITLYYTSLHGIHANEGSLISSSEVLKAGNLVLNAKEGAAIFLNLDVDHLDIKTNSGGKITANGVAGSQSVVCNSGGNYDGKFLETRSTTVSVNAGGEAQVFATETADARTRAGGNIHVYGNPQLTSRMLAGGKILTH